MNEKQVAETIRESIAVKQAIAADAGMLAQISKLAEVCIRALRMGNRILFAGNGGSAADAQHIAAELVSRYAFDRPGLPSIAFTTDTSILTAIGNDYGYDQIFRRQLEANGREGDIFFGISTSGSSPNIVAALQRARELGIIAVGLTGHDGKVMRSCCDYCLQVPSGNTPRIQESHIMIGHIICGIIEDTLFGAQGNQ